MFRETPKKLDTTTLLTVRTGWYVGYPINGGEPPQLVEATRRPTGLWTFGEVEPLTIDDRERLARACFCHFYIFASGHTEANKKRVEWMLLAGKATVPECSTMQHFRQPWRTTASRSIGV